jgi:EmrB/QacA subfamily drug resistance transporter
MTGPALKRDSRVLDMRLPDGNGHAAPLRLCLPSRTIGALADTRSGQPRSLDQGPSPAASSPDYMTSSTEGTAQPATARVSRSQEKWVLAATIIASGMAFIDMTIVNVALPVLQLNLNASFAEAQWVVEAYTLFLSALILTGGAIGDLYGRRRVFGIGIVLFALASATCGFAPDPMTLIMARAAQGIGAALMMPGSLAILSASFPPERQGRAIGLWSAATGIGAAIAPALGGWLIDTFSWRWVFLINLPLAVISLAIVFARVPESRSARRKPLDWIGILLATCGLGGLTYGLIAAGQTGFAHPLTGGILAGGVIFLALFLLAEARIAAPMLSLSLFRLPGFMGVQVFTFLLWAALSGALFFVPFRLQQIQGFKPLQAGMALLPFVIIVSILSRWAGGLSDRFGPRIPLMVGSCFAGLGFLLLTLASPQTSYLLGFMPALMTIGIGMGICVAPVTVAALGAAGEDNVGLASAVNNMAARTGGLIAIAVFGLLLADRFDAALTAALAPLNLPDTALQALAAQRAKLAAADLPAGLAPDIQAAVAAAIKTAFVSGYRWIMAAAGMMAFTSAVIAATSLARGKAPTRKTMMPQENVG